MTEYFGQWSQSRLSAARLQRRLLQRRLPALRHPRHRRWFPGRLPRHRTGNRRVDMAAGADPDPRRRARGVRERPRAAGAGRKAVHAGAGGHAGLRGAGTGDRDRRPGLAARRAPGVPSSIRCGAARSRAPRRRPRRRSLRLSPAEAATRAAWGRAAGEPSNLAWRPPKKALVLDDRRAGALPAHVDAARPRATAPLVAPVARGVPEGSRPACRGARCRRGGGRRGGTPRRLPRRGRMRGQHCSPPEHGCGRRTRSRPGDAAAARPPGSSCASFVRRPG